MMSVNRVDYSASDKRLFNRILSGIRKGRYQCIGKGSARIVYDLENGYVVKKARNIKGMAQNKVEYMISLNEDSDILARVVKASENYDYLIMEKADQVESITYVWDYFRVRNNDELYRYYALKEMILKYNLLPKDFGKESTWGKLNGRPVIIDYGFTYQVSKRFYSSLLRLNRVSPRTSERTPSGPGKRLKTRE